MAAGGGAAAPESGAGFAVALVTAADRAQAERIARALVEERLAACVNLVDGVTSIYRWEGKICEDREVLLVVKTRRALAPALAERVRALHSYTCPETVVLPIVAGAPAYLQWLGESCR